MRQLLYVSMFAVPVDQAMLDAIVHRSRHNNALDGVTGLLWVDNDRFAQVIEGDDRAVAAAMDRIRADPRHREIEVLHDRPISDREYGGWSMQLRQVGEDGDPNDTRMRRALAQASQSVRDAFASLITPTTA